jgi:MFS transporter, putative metabolite:H+ symporter
MMLGSFLTGFLGDRYGRRFTYQANLIIFGLASLASAFAPTIPVLILLRGLMGMGLGAELVAGYAAMTEFLPPQARGRWGGILNGAVVTRLPFSALVSALLIPRAGWRVMFDWWRRCTHRLVHAQSHAGIASLVGVDRPLRRS